MTSLKYGRREPKRAPALMFAQIRDAVVPQHPASYDSIAGWGGWLMLGNDREGDCVAVTWSTIRRIATRLAGAEHYPDLAQVLEVYRTQNPTFDPDGSEYDNGPGSDADQGMVIQTLLEHLVKVGGPDGVKAIAFAKVDHTNLEEVKAALATFHCLWLGVNVTDANESAFPTRPWDYSRTDRVLGGHSITGTGYTPSLFEMETWAEECGLTNTYMQKGVEEAWIVIWPEHATNLTPAQRDALDEAFYALTDRHITWPTPTPPAPSQDVPEEVLEWLQQMPRYYRKVWEALRGWLAR